MTEWVGKEGLKPHVVRSGEIIAAQFLVPRVLGVGLRTDVANSDHPLGLALDFMCPTESQNRIRIYLCDPGNWKLHNVKYVINQQKIYNRPIVGGYLGEKYTGPSPHTDHVHVSYLTTGAPPGDAGRTWDDMNDPAPGLTAAVDSAAESLGYIKQVYDALKGIGAAFSFITDPKNWWRIGLFILGAGLAITGIIKLDAPGSQVVATAARTATKAVKR